MTARSPGAPPTSASPAGRLRDAAATKDALLAAARSLFGQKGFEATGIRDIGDQAGVDPALIARYYGSKADLYIAAVVAEAQDDQPSPDFEQLSDVAEALIARTDRHGLGPVTQALIRSDTPDDIRQAARAHLRRRIVAPLAADMSGRGADRPQLQAEVAASALLGINLGRALGWFSELQDVPKKELVEIITSVLDGRAIGADRKTRRKS